MWTTTISRHSVKRMCSWRVQPWCWLVSCKQSSGLPVIDELRRLHHGNWNIRQSLSGSWARRPDKYQVLLVRYSTQTISRMWCNACHQTTRSNLFSDARFRRFLILEMRAGETPPLLRLCLWETPSIAFVFSMSNLQSFWWYQIISSWFQNVACVYPVHWTHL